MNILDQIVKHKLEEIEERKRSFPVEILERSLYFESPAYSLRKNILADEKSGIIAEIKRKSPSKGTLHENVSVHDISTGYVQAGVSALSILTDSSFFGGSNDDLIEARKYNSCPILRKDFMLDEYQIIEAKSIGADAILLIAAILNPEKIKALTNFAHSLDLEVLMEVHSEEELTQNLDAHVDLIGVNNRNLKTFEMGIEISKKLAPLIPDDVVKISESGIDHPDTIHDLRRFGYQGFLIGERFMKHTKPEVACKEFIDGMNQKLVS